MLTTPNDRPARPMRRAGFTLVELLLVIVLLGIVVGGMLGIINRQQRYYSGSAGVIETKRTVREGIGALQSELRSISPVNGDILAMTSTSIDFRANEGSSVICNIDPTRTIIVVPPPGTLASGTPLTSWLTVPLKGDLLYVHDYGGTSAAVDDSWDPVGIADSPVKAGACVTSDPFDPAGNLISAAEAANGWTITLDTPLQPSVAYGAAIRFLRHVHYELYQAADGNWYLGYYDCVPGRSPECTALEPVAGPYLAPNASQPGLSFAYFDQNGAATTDPSLVRRIDMTMRAQSATVDAQGKAGGHFTDYLSTSVAVRN